MPDQATLGRPPVGTGRDWRWVRVPLLVFAVSRVVDTLLVLHLLGSHSFEGSPPTYWEVVDNWDGAYYREIAERGYPSELPRVDGEVVQNVWAFYPVYPLLVGAVTRLGLPFAVAATMLSLVLAALAMALFFRMVQVRTDTFTATLSVAGLCFSPVGVLLQVAYTEGLALLLVLAALWCLQERRYGAMLGVALLLSLTRPVVLPLAAVAGVVWLVRLRDRRREPFPARERVALAAAAVLSAATFVLWPGLAGLATGEWDAYALTQQAWVFDDRGWSTWLMRAVTLSPPATAVLVGGCLAVLAWVVLRPDGRVWGVELRAWTFLYALYIFGASRPTHSIVRYLLLVAVPSWPFPEVSRAATSPRARGALLVGVAAAGTLMQYWWTDTFFIDTREGAWHP